MFIACSVQHILLTYVCNFLFPKKKPQKTKKQADIHSCFKSIELHAKAIKHSYGFIKQPVYLF